MKLGILTYHRSHNYGAQLQGIALRHALVKLGHDVSFIDYWPEYHWEFYALFPPITMLRNLKGMHLGYFYRLIRNFPWRLKRSKNLKRFMAAYTAPYWEKYSSKTPYDAVIYGSDQIWRKQPGLHDRFNPIYFGENKLQTKRHIAYAASMGSMDLDEADYQFLKQSLSRFERLYVREAPLCEMLRSIGLQAEVVLDPTLLLTNDEWEELLPLSERPIKEKYILFYDILTKSFDEEQVRQFANRQGLRFVKLVGGVSKRSKDCIDTAPPEIFLQLVKYAECVFTSSFHGLVFSILFHRPFLASYRRNAVRAQSLLQDLGLSHCMLAPQSAVPLDFPKIDFSDVDERMARLRQRSLDLLSSI